jgi:group II intron reverse transcriptase/maturase
VDRGTGGPAIEPRNPEFRAPTLWTEGEGHIVRRANASGERARRGRWNPRTPGNSLHENRETSATPVAKSRPVGEGASRKPHAHVVEESERGSVPMKDSNKDGQPSAESPEGRPRAKENDPAPHAVRAQQRAAVSLGLEGVRQAARRKTTGKFTSLLHHLTPELLRSSFYALQRQAAAGVDGVSWREYETGIEDRLLDLHSRVQRGAYRAQPSRRVYIPKADGRQRPLGIAAVEDKIVQQAVVTILNCIYEERFLGFSYGFRPRRSAHDALDALAVGISTQRVRWILDADIQGFFDNIDHGWLVRFLEHEIADRRILRLIRKWLKAGVSEEGEWSETKVGTPQGAVISPLLANLYLHYVFDLWVQAWRKKVATGRLMVVRYADDFVLGFEQRADAERFLEQLRERLGKFGLDLHPVKTRCIEFGRWAIADRRQRGEGKPETFDFLGFTHICEINPKSGYFVVKRKTMRKRKRAKLADIKKQLRQRMHAPLGETGEWLRAVVLGYFRYHAVPGNLRTLAGFRRVVSRLWLWTLRRRSQKRRMSWGRFYRLENRYLPPPRTCHPFPNVRFAAMHPR